MNSNTNCNNDYDTSQNLMLNNSTLTAVSSYYPSDNSGTTKNFNMWIGTEENNKNNVSRHSQEINNEVSVKGNMNENNKNKNYIYNTSQSQSMHGSSPWNLSGNSYQKLCNENNYGIILSSSIPYSSENPLPSSSYALIENNSHSSSQLQAQHLKKAYYQGLRNLIYPFTNFKNVSSITYSLIDIETCLKKLNFTIQQLNNDNIKFES